MWDVLKNSKEEFSQMVAEETASHSFTAGDIGILCCIKIYGSGQETASSVNGQPSETGVPRGRSNSAAGQIFTIYEMTLKKNNWAMKLEIISSFSSWREF